MLPPKKVKFRKMQKGTSKGIETRGTELAFGTYGLKAMGTKWLTAKQVEAARRAIIRYLKKGGKLWIRVFADKPVTSKGVEAPLGGGKGAVSHYVFPIKPGRIIFELAGIEEAMAREAFKKASSKIPIKLKFIKEE